MIMPRFMVHQPTSLEQALDLLAQHRTGVKVLSGGTDLLLNMRNQKVSPRHLVSINRVPGLSHISFKDEDGLVIGAGARLSQVAEHPAVKEFYPALARACSVMATVQIRNMGTVAGNLANAAPSADTAAPLLVYKASVVLVERDGRRQVELSKFFTGPGSNHGRAHGDDRGHKGARPAQAHRLFLYARLRPQQGGHLRRRGGRFFEPEP